MRKKPTGELVERYVHPETKRQTEIYYDPQRRYRKYYALVDGVVYSKRDIDTLKKYLGILLAKDGKAKSRRGPKAGSHGLPIKPGEEFVASKRSTKRGHKNIYEREMDAVDSFFDALQAKTQRYATMTKNRPLSVTTLASAALSALTHARYLVKALITVVLMQLRQK